MTKKNKKRSRPASQKFWTNVSCSLATVTAKYNYMLIKHIYKHVHVKTQA